MATLFRISGCIACVLLLSGSACGQFFPQPNSVPEVDPGSASGAIAIVSSGLYILRNRFRRNRSAD